ncbi:MAG: prepilin-type N-terminal cleavage/methylation domain-containing protein [Candidatus Taylorbacteria bacterium]|nr:prepilin-type N-terminal cleavage/methylation domain-containing protein [Candidatus Taylorbacteria bacterium]
MFNFLKKINQKSWYTGQAGLTLVEALVTLVVLSLGLIPALAIVSSSVRIAALIENNLIAANLAQEGVEIIRSLRDANWFAVPARSFDNGLVIGSVGQWRVEWNTNWATNPPQAAGTNPPLKLDSVTGTYTYASCPTCADTGFKRHVTVTKTTDPCGCKLIVVSRVDWTQHRSTRTINVESHLFDWK